MLGERVAYQIDYFHNICSVFIDAASPSSVNRLITLQKQLSDIKHLLSSKVSYDKLTKLPVQTLILNKHL